MDNLTHTLVGMAVAEAAVATRAASSRPVPASWRHAAYVVSIASANLPDLDILLSSLTAGKLGYLLHHRGHTHTLAFAPLAMAMILGVLWLWTKWRPKLWDSRDWGGLWLLAGAGTLLHLSLDYLNSYGVHVFWPFDDRWSYGDSVFVLEPWFWLVVAVPLIKSMRTLTARTLLRLITMASFALLWFSGLVPPVMSAAAMFSAALLWALARPLAAGGRAFLALGAALVFVFSFAAAGKVVRRNVTHEMATLFPATHLHDLALTPMPANLLCWRVLAVGAEDGAYIARDGIAPLAPQFFAADNCASLADQRSAAYFPIDLDTPGTVQWYGAHVIPLQELRDAAARCDVAAFLRFARVPFRDGHLWGDLRFDREREEGFAEMRLDGQGDCPRWVPPWAQPLGPLLHEPS